MVDDHRIGDEAVAEAFDVPGAVRSGHAATTLEPGPLLTAEREGTLVELDVRRVLLLGLEDDNAHEVLIGLVDLRRR